MKTKKALSQKEELFCIYFVKSRDARCAAAKAGYLVNNEKSAVKLLLKKNIQQRLKELESTRSAQLSEVTEGFRKIAFGGVTDAVALALYDEKPSKQELEALDLSMISDIKIPKSGGIEIKFFDRIKALEKLNEISSSNQSQASSDFLSALENSAKALHSDGEDIG